MNQSSEKSKRVLCLLLALLTVGSTMLSCGEEQTDKEGTKDSETVNKETETASDTEAEETELSKLPAADYNEHVFRVLLDEQDGRYVDILTEGKETGDTLNDLVYRRNLAVEEKYNITIEGEAMDYSDLNDLLEKCVQTNDTTYDLYLSNTSATTLATEGYLYAMNELPNVDLSNPWWDQAAVEQLSVGGKAYLVTGDIAPSSLLTSACLVFNKRLFNDYDITYPYESAKNGTWTIDSMYSIIKDVTRDMNADNLYEYDKDLFSLTSWASDSPYSFFYGCGGMLSAKDSDDYPVISYDMEKLTSIYDKVYMVIIDSNSHFVDDFDYYDTAYECFSMGNAFFCDITLQKIDTFLRDMKDEYGILPMPKYDESQEAYVSHVNGAVDFALVPSNPENAERTGMIVEALAAGAYDMITPSLYEVIAKTKNATDVESGEMVDIIIRNRVFDFYYVYNLKGYDFVNTLLKKKSTNVASTLDKSNARAEKDLQKIIDAYTAVE